MFVWKDKINEEEAGDGPFLKSENHPKNFTKVGSKFCQIYVAKKSKRPCECFKDTFIKTNIKTYLPGVGVNRDQQGGSPRARLDHCTPIELTSAISPNVGNSDA